MTTRSLAVVLASPRKFEIAERPVPQPGAGEVVVRVAATAVCHTDLSIYTGDHPGVRYPVVLGHESTGTVAAAGGAVADLVPGQAVIVNPIVACGHCDMCRRGADNLCRNAGLMGREVEGSLNQYLCLPRRYVYALPAGLPLDEATLIETLATVRHAQGRIGLKAGETVAIIGQGTTGLLHTRLAVLAGAATVIAITPGRWKLDIATRMGAEHALDVRADAAVEEVRRLTGGAGADVVIDTAGGASTLMAALDMLRPGGRLLPYAVSHERCAQFSTFPLYYKEVSIIGSRALLAVDMQPSIDLIASGRVDVAGFVSATYPLRHSAEAFAHYEADPDRYLRIVIDSTEGNT